MKNAITNHLLLLSTICVTLFLGFIDEGYYNFNFLLDFGNWIVLGVYGIGIYCCQWFLLNVVLAKVKSNWKKGFSIFAGSLVGVLVMAGFFTVWKYI